MYESVSSEAEQMEKKQTPKYSQINKKNPMVNVYVFIILFV